MSEARGVTDRITKALVEGDLDAVETLYAVDAVAVTPDLGEIKGRDQIIRYLKGFTDAFSDRRYELVAGHEAGDVAIDEGYFNGTNTNPLPDPSGELVPATGKRVRLRTCDAVTVVDGVVISHRFYYDQMDLLGQLGLLADTP